MDMPPVCRARWWARPTTRRPGRVPGALARVGVRGGPGGNAEGPGRRGVGRGRALRYVVPRDYFSFVPVERRFAHASVTRAAMPASAALPQVRGSYLDFVPTSPSTFRTPA